MFSKIQIRNNQIDNKEVKQIEMFVGGLTFYCDVQSNSDIKKAEKLAIDSGLTLHRLDESSSPEVKQIERSWENQHPNSLNDLDLSFFNLDGSNKDSPSWHDTSWCNDTRPSFTYPASATEVFVVYLAHKLQDNREDKHEDRYLLMLMPRLDDGTDFEKYELDFCSGDEPTLYTGSDFDLLIQIIMENSKHSAE